MAFLVDDVWFWNFRPLESVRVLDADIALGLSFGPSLGDKFNGCVSLRCLDVPKDHIAWGDVAAIWTLPTFGVEDRVFEAFEMVLDLAHGGAFLNGERIENPLWL